MRDIKILMVCLGNICRSPLAQGILHLKIKKNAFIDSAGTASYHIGRSPDPRSILVAKEKGIDISNYKARKFIEEDFKKFDFIYVMDNSNFENIISMADSKEDRDKVSLIHPLKKEVSDPYYGEKIDFKVCYSILENACNKIVLDLNL